MAAIQKVNNCQEAAVLLIELYFFLKSINILVALLFIFSLKVKKNIYYKKHRLILFHEVSVTDMIGMVEL